jgi:hypothetical protein
MEYTPVTTLCCNGLADLIGSHAVTWHEGFPELVTENSNLGRIKHCPFCGATLPETDPGLQWLVRDGKVVFFDMFGHPVAFRQAVIL